MLREANLHLPNKAGGGSTSPPPPPGPTPHGPMRAPRQERGLKHRAAHETRTVPILWGSNT